MHGPSGRGPGRSIDARVSPRRLCRRARRFSPLSPPLPPTNPSSDLTSPTARSGWKPRSRPKSGQVAKPVATLRSEADAAFAKRDFRSGMQTLAQIVSVAPREAGNWLRLSRAILQIRPNDDRERSNFLERAAHRRLHRLPAFRKCRRGGGRASVARPHLRRAQAVASGARRLPLRARPARSRGCAAGLRSSYATSTASASSTTRSMPTRRAPRACFQFSEDLPGKRTDFSPFVALEGNDKPAITTEEKQLCVEGLKHGERYSVTLRAGLPSTVQRNTAEVRPTTTSMCAIARLMCASPARPMCCRAPASAAFRLSASTRRP